MLTLLSLILAAVVAPASAAPSAEPPAALETPVDSAETETVDDAAETQAADSAAEAQADDDAVGTEADDDDAEPEAEPEAPPALPDPDALLTEARRRVLRGDYAGVRIVAEEALAVDGGHHRPARYLIALSLELEGRLDEALEAYEILLEEEPDDADVIFRRAGVLGKLGRPEEALAQLDALGPAGTWTGADRLKIELLRALFDLDDGGNPRKPLRALRDLLADADPAHSPYYQAMARWRLIELAVSEAEGITFVGGKRKKGRRLEARAQLVAIASEQTLAVIRLEAPEYVLQSLRALGSAHESFGQAMLDESPVKRFTDDQRRLYEAQRRQRVETLWVKAARYYERGVQYAAAVGYEGAAVDELRTAHDAVVTRVEALAGP